MPEHKKKYGIGIDLGGTSVKSAIVSDKGDIVFHNQLSVNASDSVNQIFQLIFDIINRMLVKAVDLNLTISVIGMGTPGSVDVQKGYLLGSTPNFKNWRDVSIKECIENEFNLPAFADNDANMMAFGEHAFGAGKNASNVICLTVGTGIGGGIIINNELYRGFNYCGAELGHMSIKYDGIKCNCGGIGCLEQYASATAMIREFRKKTGIEKNIDVDVKYIFNEMYNGNQIAREVIDNSAFYLGIGIANLINIFNPEKIVIGGGVAEAGEIYTSKVKKVVEKRAMIESNRGVNILSAELGNRAGFSGSVYFAFQELYKNNK